MTDQKKSPGRLAHLLNQIAHKPLATDLWKLRGTLLACSDDHPEVNKANEIAREFFFYLSELQSKLSARQYNELASRLDIGSVGTLALQDILLERENLTQNLLLGGLGEGLMVMASRQYIKAWEQELQLVHRRAAWSLYGILWELSKQHQPEMKSNERQGLIEETLTPTLDPETPSHQKMLILLRLFQVTLLLTAVPLCRSDAAAPEA